jgi:hypothetical protein
VINPDGSVDEKLFDDMKEWIETEKTPNGDFVKELNLIAPNRKSALSITEKAISIDVKRVLYIDNDDNWWNPNPKGLWLK